MVYLHMMAAFQRKREAVQHRMVAFLHETVICCPLQMGHLPLCSIWDLHTNVLKLHQRAHGGEAPWSQTWVCTVCLSLAESIVNPCYLLNVLLLDQSHGVTHSHQP